MYHSYHGRSRKTRKSRAYTPKPVIRPYMVYAGASVPLFLVLLWDSGMVGAEGPWYIPRYSLRRALCSQFPRGRPCVDVAERDGGVPSRMRPTRSWALSRSRPNPTPAGRVRGQAQRRSFEVQSCRETEKIELDPFLEAHPNPGESAEGELPSCTARHRRQTTADRVILADGRGRQIESQLRYGAGEMCGESVAVWTRPCACSSSGMGMRPLRRAAAESRLQRAHPATRRVPQGRARTSGCRGGRS